MFDGSISDVCTEPEGNWGVWPHGLECQLWEHTGWISQSHRMNLIMEEKRLQTRFSTVVSILIYIFPSFGSRWNLYFIKLFPTWPFQAFPCATSVSLALSILLHINDIDPVFDTNSKLLTFPHENARWVTNVFACLNIFHYARIWKNPNRWIQWNSVESNGSF